MKRFIAKIIYKTNCAAKDTKLVLHYNSNATPNATGNATPNATPKMAIFQRLYYYCCIKLPKIR